MFQSTPPRGGRHVTVADGPAALEVSIHAPAWGATDWRTPGVIDPDLGFNPRPRVGGDVTAAQQHEPSSGFNPRPRVGGDGTSDAARVTSRRFNPRPRVGGDRSPFMISKARRVSIHAPAWGATRRCYRSIRSRMFQSTPPRGGRPVWSDDSTPIPTVSIHAPAWGATRRVLRRRQLASGFNPRPRVGGDAVVGCSRELSTSFNPRPRVGGDSASRFTVRTGYGVSIHAPAWGATH